MPLYPLLASPGFTTDGSYFNIFDPDTKTIVVYSLPTTNIGSVYHDGSFRAIPFIGYKGGSPIFGYRIDTGDPTYAVVGGRSTDPMFTEFVDAEDWARFLVSLDSLVDFPGRTLQDGTTIGSPLLLSTKVFGKSDGKELYLGIDKHSSDEYSVVLISDDPDQSSFDLGLWGVQYHTASISDLGSVDQKVSALSSRVDEVIGATTSQYVSR